MTLIFISIVIYFVYASSWNHISFAPLARMV
jgi:hypothetical protein